MPKKERKLLGERMRKSEAPAGFKNKPLLSALPLSEGSADRTPILIWPLVEISWILRHDGATQENRRIRRRLQGAAAPKPIEALHFSWSIDQVLFLLLLLSEETIHTSHTRKVIYSEINDINGLWYAWNRLYIPWNSETFFWQDHLTKPIFNKLHLSSDEQFSQKS